MNKPAMIIFDYGHTLLCEQNIDFMRGQKALFEHIKSNKYNLTPEQVHTFARGLFEEVNPVRESGIELHHHQYERFVYEYLGIEFSIPVCEVERVWWENSAPAALMPNVNKMLNYINANGIRSAVISNIGWSGTALTERINRLLPQNKFEFIIASSEYMFRKPSPMIFELALRKANLNPSDVWFCGDNVEADAEGSAAVGIFPVWYEDKTLENPWHKPAEMPPNCEHLHIHDWFELIEVLDKLPVHESDKSPVVAH